MALKALMLRKKIDDKKKALEALRAKDSDFQTREAELEASINEAQTDEEKQTVEEAVTQFETDKATHDQAKADLEREVGELEGQLAEEEKKQDTDPVPQPERREENHNMGTRTKFFNMTVQERDAFFAREDVKGLLTKVRSCIKEQRALTNVGLTIPEVMLPLLREIVEANSKLLPYVTRRSVPGKARQNIMGTIPEAVWTEMCATLNELSLGFNNIEVDGYKVGGFFAVCNAILEDSDLSLATELLNCIGIAIAKATDKAIVYGKGTKMPLGFVTRLAQTAAPSDYPETARPWADLHSSNIITITGKTGLALFQEIVKATKEVKNDYYKDGLVWIMNENTHTDLLVHSMDKNLNAAVVAGMGDTMPVKGGKIVEEPFMADGDIAFGYLGAYLWADRAGVQLGQSEHYRFVEDQTVFKGTMRADGKPVIAEAFGILNISGAAPTTTVTFPSDTANTTGGTTGGEG